MPPLNENAPTTVPAISHRSNAQGNEQSNMNAKEETKHDSTQSQQQQQQQPASNSHDHHNAIMNALRRRGVNGKPKSSRYKRKYNSIDTTFKVNANIDASNSNDCFTPRRNNNANYQLSKNKRSHVVEQHYKIDRNRALLPGVPKYDVDLARDIHDFFNLICLVPIIALNVLNWNWDKLFERPYSKDGIPFIHCWTGEFFDIFFCATVAYFIIDLVWVAFIPKAVKSSSTIIQHHIASLLYLIIPYKVTTFRFLMGICMSVEINTWFLIARRVFNKQGFPPWTIDLPYLFSIKVKLISISFYITWISIRCLLYPYVSVVFYRLAKRGALSEEEKIALSIGCCLHVVFCFLNVKWTIDLVNSKVRQWKNKKCHKMENGL